MIKTKVLLLMFFVVAFAAKASHIDTLMVASEMGKTLPNLVILPDSYDSNSEEYPVLYLLHGAGGNFKDWLKKVPALANYVDHYDFIIVCPDGGVTSWYFDSPIDPTMQYETYISQEVLSAVDATYRTKADRKGRAITGLSMGGHGAFYLAFRHQDIWGAAGSTSGGLDIRPFSRNWNISKRLGTYAENKAVWEKNTVINSVYLLDGKQMKLIFDCGTDDFFYDANCRMHAKLEERNIPHDFIVRPGGHTKQYWANSIQYQLYFFNDFFDNE